MTTSLKVSSVECLPLRGRPIVVAPQDSAATLLDRLADSPQDDIPVVADDGRCVGLADASTLYAHWLAHGGNLDLRNISVADLPLRAPRYCGPGTTVDEVVALLIEDCQPIVVEHDGRFVGMIRVRDFLAQFAGLWPQRAQQPVRTLISRVEEILEATLTFSSAVALMVRNRSQVAVLTHNDTVLAAVTVAQVTNWHMLSNLLRTAIGAQQVANTLLQALPGFVAVQPQQAVADVALQMADHHCPAVPVVNRAGHLVGVATAERLLALAL